MISKLFAIYFFGTFPLVTLVYHEQRNKRLIYLLLSPSIGYTLSYILGSIVRTSIYFQEGISYPWSDSSIDNLVDANIIVAIANYVFAFSYFIALSKYRYLREFVSKFSKVKVCNLKHLYFSTIFFSSTTITYLYIYCLSNNMLSLNLGQNRINYSNSLDGFGLLSIILLTSTMIPIMSLLIAKHHLNSSVFTKVSYIFIITSLIVCVMVSARQLLMSSIVLVFLITQNQYSKTKTFNFTRYISLVLLLLIIPLLGVLRGGTSLSLIEDNKINYLYIFLIYISSSFDQISNFADTLSKLQNNSFFEYFYGSTYIQDILFTYIPRVLFSEKPYVYGTKLVEQIITMRTSSELQVSTYPLGLYAESYINFGYLGIYAVIFGIGFFLSTFYSISVDVICNFKLLKIKNPVVYFIPLLYFSCAILPLGYLRSLGGFFASLMGLLFMYIALLVFNIAIAQFLFGRFKL